MRREHKYLLLIVILLSIVVGYAFLNVELKINGTATIKNPKWNVHFENYQKTYNTTVYDLSEPEIEGDNTTEIEYSVTFLEPGDVYEFTVDIKNSGNINANIDSLETTVFDGENELSGIPDYIDYSITYANGDEYLIPHELKLKQKETIAVRIKFKRSITSAQYEEITGKTLRFHTVINCVQGESSSVPNYVYTNSKYQFNVGADAPEQAVYYDDYHDINTSVFLRHKLVMGKIESTELGYIHDGNAYFVPSFSVDNNDDFFDRVTNVMMSEFGEDVCSYYSEYDYRCYAVSAYVYHGYYISAEDDDFKCVLSDLYSYCALKE